MIKVDNSNNEPMKKPQVKMNPKLDWRKCDFCGEYFIPKWKGQRFCKKKHKKTMGEKWK